MLIAWVVWFITFELPWCDSRVLMGSVSCQSTANTATTATTATKNVPKFSNLEACVRLQRCGVGRCSSQLLFDLFNLAIEGKDMTPLAALRVAAWLYRTKWWSRPRLAFGRSTSFSELNSRKWRKFAEEEEANYHSLLQAGTSVSSSALSWLKLAMPGQNFIEERHASAREVIVGQSGIIGRDWLANPIPF